jgi:hypothetical protein
VYFLLKDPNTEKEVLNTIEFDSCTLREFKIPGLAIHSSLDKSADDDASTHSVKYVIMDIKDPEKRF